MVRCSSGKLKVLLSAVAPVLAGVYLGFFVQDIRGVLTVLENNDSVSSLDLSYGNINEVRQWEETETGYTVLIDGTYSTEVDIPYGEVVYHCEKQSADWYSMRVADDSLFWATEGIEGDVILTEEGFQVGDILYESLPTIEVLLKNDMGERLRVFTGYTRELTNMEINYCRTLPTDKIYFNKVTSTLVRNIDDNFAWNYLMSASYPMLLFAVSLYGVALVRFVGKWDWTAELWMGTLIILIIFAMLTLLLLG